MQQPTHMIEVVRPQYLNHHGNLFGGHALQMMDTAAFTAATRYGRKTMVTVAVRDVAFIAPVKHGEIVEIIAKVISSGTSSVTVDVQMLAECLLSGEVRTSGTATFVFVAVDENGKAIPLDPPTKD